MKRVIICLFICLLFGCGRKVDPNPPYAVRPVPPQDIRVTLHLWGAELSFKVPRKKVNGRPLDHLKGFEVLRWGQTVEGPKATYKKYLFLPFKGDWDKVRRFYFRDRHLLSGVRYRYQIRAVRGWRCISDPAYSPIFAWHTPPEAPAHLMAKAGDGQVTLRWEKVDTYLDGQAIRLHRLKYRVYRVVQTGKIPLKLVDTNYYLDQQVENEHLYCYQVAAVLVYFGSLIEGPLSPKACAKPIDITPPRAPEDLVAVPIKGGVLLRWHRNTEPDLAGYRVFRRRPGGLPKLLNKKLLTQPEFFDRNIPGPGLYYYWVTAVDSSPRANESPPSEMVEVEILPKEVR